MDIYPANGFAPLVLSVFAMGRHRIADSQLSERQHPGVASIIGYRLLAIAYRDPASGEVGGLLGASLGPADGSHFPAASASAEELIAAIGLEPRYAYAGRHLEAL